MVETGEDFREIEREREMAPRGRGEYINVEGLGHVKGHVRGGVRMEEVEAGSGWVNRNSLNVGGLGQSWVDWLR